MIREISAREILDSRGRPTVSATCELASGARGTASVPSGASTGRAEAHELRDGDPARFAGLGCRKAVANIRGEIRAALCGRDWENQVALDRALIDLDGTPQKTRLGANAVLAVSLAFAHAVAGDRGTELWLYFAGLLGTEPSTMPRLTINLFSGGKHAGGQVAIQDVLVVPQSATSIERSLEITFDVYAAAARLCAERYNMRLLRADEGGLAPPFSSIEEMLDTAVDAIEQAGYSPGADVALAIDVAASQFASGGHYSIDSELLSSGEMIERVAGWVDRYPIVSVEDGLAEDDWEHWPALCARIGSRVLVLGDDLLCTQTRLVQRAIDCRAATALLLKVNQAGTLTEAAEACTLARSAGWQVTVSVRSGDTEDDWAADLAVGWSGDQFKGGSITQSERLAKYNRLLEIESDTGFLLPSNKKCDGLRSKDVHKLEDV